jgi:hypothetical protein
MDFNMEQVSVDKIINHALRRCGLTTPQNEPEIILLAKDNLEYTLLDMNNKGVPIYLVQKVLQGFQPQKWIYNLPTDTYDIFNTNWRQFNQVNAVASGGVDPQFLTDSNWHTWGYTTDQFTLLSSQPIYFDNFGLCFFEQQTVQLKLEVTLDFLTWTEVISYPLQTYTDGQWIWYDMDNPLYGVAMRVTTVTGATLSLRGFVSGDPNSAYEQATAKMNRDDFFSLPQKGIIGSPINYYFQKTITPQLQLWQSPPQSNCFNWLYVMYVLKAPIAENMSLPASIQTPKWYVDSIIWGLAAKMAWELPNVSPERVNMLMQQKDAAIELAGSANADSSNINLIGNSIAAYTRI